MHRDIWLVRHGETAWSLSGAHTGRTDIPLTANGEKGAVTAGHFLAGHNFAMVLSSPLQRARRTAELAGFGAVMQLDPNLEEWNYGDYEGRTSAEIQSDRPGWSPFREGFPSGETIEQVAARAQKVIDRALTADGNALLFAHGHILRILAATWLGIEPNAARLFALSPVGISVLGYEHETRVINRWNLPAH
jgi:probable phosphoglycerate mutase